MPKAKQKAKAPKPARPSTWAQERRAGVLLPVFSLPSRFGIGDLGPAAYEFADRLAGAGIRFWQILPLNPTDARAGESPYFSTSALAGNPLLIDLEALAQEGLVDAGDLAFPKDLPPQTVDFQRVRPLKMQALGKAAGRLLARGLDDGFARFEAQQAHWLEDYALFMEITKSQGGRRWCDWPPEYRDRQPEALAVFSKANADALLATKALQYLFFRQWRALQAHCRDKGLLLLGDMPIYVCYDSADVWAHPGLFKLGKDRQPTMVSGAPPDYFSSKGQLWNTPVYDWQAMAASGYDWWVRRMTGLFALYDIVRIDHFRGLVQFWQVPAGAADATGGAWAPGPGAALFDRLLAACPDFPVVAEDLGQITPDVVAVKERYGMPGMMVMHYAFDSARRDNPHRPENHPALALVYLGTHDNDTTESWLQSAKPAARRRLAASLGGEGEVTTQAFMQLALASKANIAVLTAQDLLRLPGRARINNPATQEGNWRWRLTDDECQRLPFDWLAGQVAASGRQTEQQTERKEEAR